MDDDIWDFLGRLSDALDAQAARERAKKEARYNSPEARAARSARSLKAAETRRALREAEERQEALEADWDARIPDGPLCDAMDVVMDAREVFCIRSPHTSGDHEDIDGHTWPYEED
jgi:flagellar hook-length control protein FliK